MFDATLPYIRVIGPFTLNTMTNMVGLEGKLIAQLTRFESVILQTLANKPGETVGRTEINKALYGDRLMLPTSNGLEVIMRRLRVKLDPNRVRLPIETVRGRGYKLRNDWPQEKTEQAA